jgi:hypothetical protein
MSDTIVAAHIAELRRRLDKASELARAADACAVAGSTEAALDVVMDVEQPLYEATTLLNAASLMNRLRKEHGS